MSSRCAQAEPPREPEQHEPRDARVSHVSPRARVDHGERFSHPHPKSIARVVAGREDVALHFNYASEFNEPWLDPANQKKWKYTADHGDDGAYALDVAG